MPVRLRLLLGVVPPALLPATASAAANIAAGNLGRVVRWQAAVWR